VTNLSPAHDTATNTEVLHVTLVYSPAPRQVKQLELRLPKGTTVAQAIEHSGLLNEYPDINHVLRDLDRVEIYRPLLVDPKVARRERFQKQGTRGAGLFAKRRPGAKPGY
jgi:putative ubiquitin-RnfH superfamily antitoxin RatB of RatAB toxin-antitoxin module